MIVRSPSLTRMAPTPGFVNSGMIFSSPPPFFWSSMKAQLLGREEGGRRGPAAQMVSCYDQSELSFSLTCLKLHLCYSVLGVPVFSSMENYYCMLLLLLYSHPDGSYGIRSTELHRSLSTAVHMFNSFFFFFLVFTGYILKPNLFFQASLQSAQMLSHLLLLQAYFTNSDLPIFIWLFDYSLPHCFPNSSPFISHLCTNPSLFLFRWILKICVCFYWLLFLRKTRVCPQHPTYCDALRHRENQLSSQPSPAWSLASHNSSCCFSF